MVENGVVATSEAATATVDGFVLAVAAVAEVVGARDCKGVEAAQSPSPVAAGARVGMAAEHLGEVDWIGIFRTMANVADFGGDNAFLVRQSLSFRRRNILGFLRRNFDRRHCFQK